jgi:hypothetical protein
LRPGGLAIFIEPDLTPHVEPGDGLYNVPEQWQTFWDTFRYCLAQKGVDPDIPQKLQNIVQNNRMFENVVTRQIDVPVGFWPKGELNFELGFTTYSFQL